MSGAAQTVDGVDVERVEAWLVDHVPGAVAPFAYTRIAGGRSNLTYEVADARGRRFVLRRPPLGHVLQSAHDVAREHRIISELHGTPVPVATPLGFCADPAVNGTPFYVMDFVEGTVLRTEEQTRAALDEAGRDAAGRSLVDTLADLHALDPAAVGLADLGRPDGYAERQLRRWYAQFERSKDRDVPVIDEVHRRLSAHVPAQRRTSIVHGDYRVDNCMLAPGGAVRAVLDWELCTLGDPLADLGLLLVYWVDEGEDTSAVLTGTATAAPGFPRKADVAARYAERTGADLSDLDFFVALGNWKLACVFEGIRARYGAGAMGGDGFSVEASARMVGELGERALSCCEGLRW